MSFFLKVSLLTICCTLSAVCFANNSEPNNFPIIKINNESQAAGISVLQLLNSDNRLIAASQDKTLRLWRTRDLKPLQSFRIPIDLQNEGKIFAISISPDNNTLAVGGWTCWDWENSGCVYLLDAHTGKIVKRIGNLPNIISNIEYSPDGAVLAIGMHGHGGVAFFDTKTFTRLGQDQIYNERVKGISFSKNGYIATGSLDGYLRIYDKSFNIFARIQIPDISLISSVFFSPDNSKLLIGSHNSANVYIVTFPKLQVEKILKVSNENQRSLHLAAWSRSGDFIYAVGELTDTQASTIYRWSIKNLDQYESITIPTHRIFCILPFDQNGLIFSTEDSSLGIIGNDGKLTKLTQSAISDFPQMSSLFRVSNDGNKVAFPVNQRSSDIAVFDINRLNLDYSSYVPAELNTTHKQSTVFHLTEWENSQSPQLNGRKLLLEPFETTRSAAFSSDAKTVFLGTEWNLRAYDKSGQLKWKSVTPGVVWNLEVSDNSSLIVAAISDGTIRWYSSIDGKETIALYIDPATREWVLWRPDGYYASSENGDNLIGWHVNRGKDQNPDFYRAVQFERQFYRPDLLKNMVYSQKPSKAIKNAQAVTRQNGNATRTVRNNLTSTELRALTQINSDFTIDKLSQFAPPRIAIDSIKTVVNPNGMNELEFSVIAEKNSLPMQDINIYANLIPLVPDADRQLKADETERFNKSFRIPIEPGDNQLRVEINNGVSLGLAEQIVEVNAEAQNPQNKGNLYIVSVGVNSFPLVDKEVIPNLAFAVNDAAEIAKLLHKPNSLFDQIFLRQLTDVDELQPTKQNILQALQLFEQAGPNDTVVLYIASHGFSDPIGNYFFVPNDVLLDDVLNIQSGGNLTGKSGSLVGWGEFFDAMHKASGRRVMIVDTCQAKNIFGEFDSRSLRKRSAAALFPLLLASKGDEDSQEYPIEKHGLFTYALLEGLNGKADVNKDKKITVGELYNFIVPLVEKLHSAAHTQTPQLIAPGNLSEIELISVSE